MVHERLRRRHSSMSRGVGSQCSSDPPLATALGCHMARILCTFALKFHQSRAGLGL